MPWSDRHIADWNELITQFDSHDLGPPSRPTVLFRGQADQCWKLEDSLTRHLAGKCTIERALEIEQYSLGSFKSQAHLYIPSYDLPDDHDPTGFLKWWATMQHFGAPTRLLDWTRSPFVATYFAVGQPWEKAGAIWIFTDVALRYANVAKNPGWDYFSPKPLVENFLEPDSPMQIFPFELKKYNIRVATQQGAFTACGRLLSDHGNLVSQTLDGEPDAKCIRLIIKPTLKPIFMKKLLAMNVNGTSLFPGLDGLGQSISDTVRIEKEFA